MRARAFTLVEILIVVVILGILAAIVVPQYARATDDAKEGATLDQLNKIRNAVAVYYIRNYSQFPTISAGSTPDESWGPLLENPDYLRRPPVNLYSGGSSSNAGMRVILRDTPDTEFTTEYGWIFNPANGRVWAAGFDAQDKPIRPAP